MASRNTKSKSSTPVHGLPRIWEPDATVLILGSIPSDDSIKAQQYYANDENAFWDIIIDKYGPPTPADTYDNRVKLLTDNKIALWDIIGNCMRTSSANKDIDLDTVNFTSFISELINPSNHIEKIIINGKCKKPYECLGLFKKAVNKYNDDNPNAKVKPGALNKSNRVNAIMTLDLGNGKTVQCNFVRSTSPSHCSKQMSSKRGLAWKDLLP